MDATSKIREFQKQMIRLLCIITIPEDVLPHTVFVEEEDSRGDPTFAKYSLISINQKKETCILCNMMKREVVFHLSDINIEWLATILDRCYELMPEKQLEFPEPIPDKESWAFLYPYSRFQRNTSDARIIAGYEKHNNKNPVVEKLTPDELAEKINDGMFNDQEYYIRFIMLPKRK